MNDQEHQEQVRLFSWAAREAETRPELGLLFAVPNGGRRDAVTGARLKAEGVRRGVPDVWLPVARGAYHGCVIELKANIKGRATREQIEWMQNLEKQGYYTHLAIGAEAAKQLLISYLAL